MRAVDHTRDLADWRASYERDRKRRGIPEHGLPIRNPPRVVNVFAGLATATGTAHGPAVTAGTCRAYVSLWDGSLLRVDGPRSHQDRRAVARLALTSDWERSDNQVASAIGSGYQLVRRVRAELEELGVIPQWKPDGPGPQEWTGQLVREELLADPMRSNLKIGAVVGCRDALVGRMRIRLEAAGAIPRHRGPGSPLGTAARAELLRDPGQRNRAIAARVGCSDVLVGRHRRDMGLTKP